MNPWLSVGLFGLAVVYLFVPSDLIPDHVPYFGYLDDLTALAVSGFVMVRAVSDSWCYRMSQRGDATLAHEVWALTDERVGNTSQTLGVAERLGLPVRIRRIEYTPRIRIPNLARGGSLIGVDEETLRLKPPWPKLVIATGRRLAPVSRHIKRRSLGRTKIVQIMDPEWAPGQFDLVVVPEHDRVVRGRNVMRVTGAPHRITPERLAKAAQEWSFDEAVYPRPWVGVLVGGDAKGIRFDEAKATELGNYASEAVGLHGGSLLITTSRRTHRSAADALLAAISVPVYFHRWSLNGKNPLFVFLAVANYIVVTGDSISMCAEACAAGKPVYIYAPHGLASRKYRRYHDDLYAKNLARPFSSTLSDGWQAPPFDPTAEVAARVITLISDRAPSARTPLA
jgi:mitochondrial fission protein ELM1